MNPSGEDTDRVVGDRVRQTFAIRAVGNPLDEHGIGFELAVEREHEGDGSGAPRL
jgi:hypothetical protein